MKIYSYKAMIRDGQPYLEPEKSFKVDGRITYRTPSLVADFILHSLGIRNCADEYLYCICLDAKAHLIGCFQASHGGVAKSLVPRRDIFHNALMIGAASIIMTHNHPSGDPIPSQEDLDATKMVIEAGKLLEVPLLDHIIVSRYGWVSMKENGYITEEQKCTYTK